MSLKQGMDVLVVGHIAGVYGVKGWLKIHSDTSPRQNILNYTPWLLAIEDGWRECEPIAGRRQGKGIVAQLAGVTDRDQARSLIGTEIAVRRTQLDKLPAGEYYWHELCGLQVVNLDGVELGTVDHLIETGANDVLVLRGERKRLIPYVMDQVIKEVDLEAGRMRVDWHAED